MANCNISSGDCWFVTATIERELVDFLVDPGAMVTAISWATFTTLKNMLGSELTMLPLTRSVQAANNSKMKGLWIL